MEGWTHCGVSRWTGGGKALVGDGDVDRIARDAWLRAHEEGRHAVAGVLEGRKGRT